MVFAYTRVIHNSFDFGVNEFKLKLIKQERIIMQNAKNQFKNIYVAIAISFSLLVSACTTEQGVL